MSNTRSGTLKGDLFGGLAAATISLPMSIGYSITAFSSLGGDFLPLAAVIGINAVVLSCLFTAIFNGTPTLISGPSGPVTIVLVTVITELQIILVPFSNLQNHSTLILGSAALCLLAGGLFQTLLGYFRIGTLTKYVPYPVVSGFINGIAISLILRQLPNLLATGNGVPVLEVIRSMDLYHLAALLVGSTTIGSVLIAKRYLPRLSPPLLGLLTGVSLYYAMGLTMDSVRAGPVIGEIRLEQINATFTAVVLSIQDLILIGSILPDVLFFGLLICLVSSIETLMSSAAIGYRTGERYDNNRDLLGQGIGNIAAGLISAMPSSGSLIRSVANMNTGGKTRRSGIICSVLILLAFFAAQQVLGKIPLAVLSGLIIAVSLSLFDGSEITLFFRTLREEKFSREIGLNFLISLTVTVLTVAVDLALAIIVGLLITTANFVVKTGKSVIRRTYRCDQMQSKRVRNMEHTRYLKNNGSQILVVELQGPLFFGSAEEVAKEIEATNHGTDYTIINMKRISEIDSTGSRSLLQIHTSLEKQGKTLLVSHIWEGNHLWDALNNADAIDIIGRNHFFPDIDSALEFADNTHCLI
jgi:SulP family sulfate permease